MRFAQCFSVVLVPALLAGCAAPSVNEFQRLFQVSGESLLKQALHRYEQGRHAEAAEQFHEALDAGLRESDQVAAHKYLAFIHCAARRERQCRAHFRTALEIDPGFELTAEEATHPAWGSVFQSLKARSMKRRGA